MDDLDNSSLSNLEKMKNQFSVGALRERYESMDIGQVTKPDLSSVEGLQIQLFLMSVEVHRLVEVYRETKEENEYLVPKIDDLLKLIQQMKEVHEASSPINIEIAEELSDEKSNPGTPTSQKNPRIQRATSKEIKRELSVLKVPSDNEDESYSIPDKYKIAGFLLSLELERLSLVNGELELQLLEMKNEMNERPEYRPSVVDNELEHLEQRIFNLREQNQENEEVILKLNDKLVECNNQNEELRRANFALKENVNSMKKDKINFEEKLKGLNEEIGKGQEKYDLLLEELQEARLQLENRSSGKAKHTESQVNKDQEDYPLYQTSQHFSEGDENLLNDTGDLNDIFKDIQRSNQTLNPRLTEGSKRRLNLSGTNMIYSKDSNNELKVLRLEKEVEYLKKRENNMISELKRVRSGGKPEDLNMSSGGVGGATSPQSIMASRYLDGGQELVNMKNMNEKLNERIEYVQNENEKIGSKLEEAEARFAECQNLLQIAIDTNNEIEEENKTLKNKLEAVKIDITKDNEIREDIERIIREQKEKVSELVDLLEKNKPTADTKTREVSEQKDETIGKVDLEQREEFKEKYTVLDDHFTQIVLKLFEENRDKGNIITQNNEMIIQKDSEITKLSRSHDQIKAEIESLQNSIIEKDLIIKNFNPHRIEKILTEASVQTEEEFKYTNLFVEEILSKQANLEARILDDSKTMEDLSLLVLQRDTEIEAATKKITELQTGALKQDKKETINKKPNPANQDSNEDLILEKEKEIESLKQEKQRLEALLQTQKKQLEISTQKESKLLTEMGSWNREINQKDKKIEDLKKELSLEQEKLDKSMENLTREQIKMNELKEAISEKQNQLIEIQNKNFSNEKRLEIQENMIENYKQEINKKTNEYTNRIKELEGALKEVEKELSLEQEKLDKSMENLTREQIKMNELKEAISEKQNQLIEIQNKNFSNEKRLEIQENMIENYKQEINKKTNEYTNRIKELEGALKEVEKELEEVTRSLNVTNQEKLQNVEEINEKLILKDNEIKSQRQSFELEKKKIVEKLENEKQEQRKGIERKMKDLIELKEKAIQELNTEIENLKISSSRSKDKSYKLDYKPTYKHDNSAFEMLEKKLQTIKDKFTLFTPQVNKPELSTNPLFTDLIKAKKEKENSTDLEIGKHNSSEPESQKTISQKLINDPVQNRQEPNFPNPTDIFEEKRLLTMEEFFKKKEITLSKNTQRMADESNIKKNREENELKTNQINEKKQRDNQQYPNKRREGVITIEYLDEILDRHSKIAMKSGEAFDKIPRDRATLEKVETLESELRKVSRSREKYRLQVIGLEDRLKAAEESSKEKVTKTELEIAKQQIEDQKKLLEGKTAELEELWQKYAESLQNSDKLLKGMNAPIEKINELAATIKGYQESIGPHKKRKDLKLLEPRFSSNKIKSLQPSTSLGNMGLDTSPQHHEGRFNPNETTLSDDNEIIKKFGSIDDTLMKDSNRFSEGFSKLIQQERPILPKRQATFK